MNDEMDANACRSKNEEAGGGCVQGDRVSGVTTTGEDTRRRGVSEAKRFECASVV